MRIINVVEVVDNVVSGIHSFGVFEEQLSDDVVQEAEQLFRDLVSKQIEPDDDQVDNNLDDYIEEGAYESNGYSISIVWSYIEGGVE